MYELNLVRQVANPDVQLIIYKKILFLKMENLSKLKPMMGIGICALSSLFLCTSNALVKYLKIISPITLFSARFLYIWLLSQPVSISRFQNESPFPRGKRHLLLIRGLIGATDNVLTLWAYQVSP